MHACTAASRQLLTFGLAVPAAAAALLLAADEVALRGLFAAVPWGAAAEARLTTGMALACGFPAGFFSRTAAKTPAIDATPAAQAPITRGRVFAEFSASLSSDVTARVSGKQVRM